jgi:hypothetical protein
LNPHANFSNFSAVIPWVEAHGFSGTTKRECDGIGIALPMNPFDPDSNADTKDKGTVAACMQSHNEPTFIYMLKRVNIFLVDTKPNRRLLYMLFAAASGSSQQDIFPLSFLGLVLL